MKIISHAPVKVFIASYNRRYWYPYRLQHAAASAAWVKDESLEYIVDSAIHDDSIGNAEVLDVAHERNADFVIPSDVLRDQAATTAAVDEFMALYDQHACRAKPLVPLQPPHDEHYADLDGYSHYVLGGIADAEPTAQLAALRRFRETAGYHVYAHGLGLGASLPLIRGIRENPRLLDSLDVSTPERVIRQGELPDKSWSRTTFRLPRGDDTTTVRAQYALAVALQLNYMLGPFCDDAILTDAYAQSTLAEVGVAADAADAATDGDSSP